MTKTQQKNTATLELPRPLVNQILAHAQHNPEEEICGLISAKNNEAVNYYRVANTADDTGTQFEMDSKQQIAAMKQMRENGETLMAIVHSHPHAPAIPSNSDREKNEYTDLYYLIVSLDTKGVLDMRSYLLEDGEYTPVELILEHNHQ